MRSKDSRLAASVSVLALAIGLAGTAAAEPASAPADASKASDNEIVVTGSLIQRPNNTAVSPIVTVGQQVIKETGVVNVQDALNQFPSFTTAGNTATGGQGTGGRASVNLHGLGTNRNLVLLDGKRLPLSDVNGNVDPNILPSSIIASIDVITGGASAVYGSDAMSGVVNFKTVRNFEGVRADVQDSISQKGDANKLDASLALGTHFSDDRGHLLAAFSYSDQDPVNGSTRPFFHDKTPSSFLGTSTFVPSATNAPNAAVVQSVFAKYGVASTINPLLNEGFNNDGTLYVQTGAVNYRGPTDGNGYLIVAGNVRMPVGQQVDFINGLQRKTAFLKADYDIAPSITAYGQFLYVDLNVHTASGGSLTQFGTLTTVPVTNPFIPADLKTILASRPNPASPFTWNGRYVGVPYKNWDENYKVQQYMAGLRGDITSGWTFDVFASYDQSDHHQVLHDAVLKSKVQTLLNAADGGNSLCSGGFDPFGDANFRSLSVACVNYLTKNAISDENLSQTQVQGQINGKLFDLGAGPAQIAFVGDYRRNTYGYVPDSDLQAQNIEAVIASLPASGHISVKEFAAQLDVPLLARRPYIEEFGIGAAVRVSDYSTSGTVTSFEADGRWRPFNALLIRGSFQRAVRAPNIGELFSPQQGTQLVIGTPPGALGDPCDVRSTARTGSGGAQVAALCVAQGIPAAAISSYTFPTTATGQLVSGNLGLTPEKANTYNVGFVLNSPLSGGLLAQASLSLDYYSISITNVISTVPGLTVLSKCYNLDGSNPSYDVNNLYCKLIQRDVTGQLVTVATPYLNLGALKTDGVEAQVNWNYPLTMLEPSGHVFVTSAIGWLHKYEVQLLPGGPFLDYTGISNGGAGPSSVPPRATPKWKALTTAGYRSDLWSLGLRWRYQASMADTTAVLTPATAQVGVPSYSLWDLFGSVKVGKNAEVRAGVNNLFDRDLPFVSSSQNGTDVALYDAIGRSFYFGVNLKF
jgi:outer membrane receptor protein involved in Fe transport